MPYKKENYKSASAKMNNNKTKGKKQGAMDYGKAGKKKK